MIMDQGWCASAITFRAREGTSDGVTLDGRTVVFAVDFPGPTLFDGNATARLYIDDAANADQRRKLEAICSGNKGGPMAALAPLIASGCRPESRQSMSRRRARPSPSPSPTPGASSHNASATRKARASRSALLIPRPVTNPPPVDLAPSGSRWSDPDLRQFETKSGARGEFKLEWVIGCPPDSPQLGLSALMKCD
jgi:hypothetical protein